MAIQPIIWRRTGRRLKKVTLADLKRAAEKYIQPGKLAILVVGNESEIKPGLDALDIGAVHPVDITIKQPRPPAGAAGGPTQ